MYRRTETRPVMVGSVQIGGQNKVVLQSMTNSRTADVEGTVAQCLRLEKGGCQIVRFAVPQAEDARAIRQIKKRIHMPVVADIHFDYRLALEAVEAGADAVRINPGNIGSRAHVEEVVRACRARHIPIRIGVNSGSLEKQELEKAGRVTADGIVESAARHIQILEELDFHDIVLSFKSSDVPMTIEAYEKAARRWPYPLHLGVTEAGGFFSSSVKTSCAMGALLARGIGDTMRVSVAGTPEEELRIGRKILKSFHLIENTPELVACPTCGRTAYDMLAVLPQIEDYLQEIRCDIKVAVMGCAVNGPGEAREADVGIAGGKKEALLFRRGKVLRKVPQEKLVEELEKEIDAVVKEKSA